MMPTIEESAEQFRLGRQAYFEVEKIGNTTGIHMVTTVENHRRLSEMPRDFLDGWQSARRESEIEAHLEREANNGHER